MTNQKSNKFISILLIIASILMMAIAVCNLIMIASSYIDEEHMPSAFGVSPVIVLSGSMSPTFETGALIFIKDVDATTLETGDVICYLSEGVAITHRIIEVKTVDGNLTFTTQGDANNTADRSYVYTDQIEGKYFTHVNGLGNFAMFMQTTVGVIVCIVVPIALYVFFDIRKRKINARKEKEKNAQLQAELEQYRNANSQGSESGESKEQ